jgi:hypothetical protein
MASDLCLPITPFVRKVATAAWGNDANSVIRSHNSIYDRVIPVQAWVLPLPPNHDPILGCDVLCQHRVRLDVEQGLLSSCLRESLR